MTLDPHPTSRSRRAFTLLELLVVVAIIALGTTLLIPAFGNIIGSAKFTGAINTVTATLGQARALAIRNGRETGVVFLFDVERERYTMQVVELLHAGWLTDRSTTASEHTHANAYSPAANTVPVELPTGTGVFGLSFLTAPDTGPTSTIDNLNGGTRHWYAGEQYDDADSGLPVTPWIFPRNDARVYLNDTVIAAGKTAWDPAGTATTGALFKSNAGVRTAIRQANTFFVCFSRDGAVMSAQVQGGVTLINAYLEYPNEPRDLDDPSAAAFDKPNVFDPDAGIRDNFRQSPNPEVVMRSVSQLAVVDLRRLGEVTGIAKPWLSRSPNSLPRRTDINNTLYSGEASLKKLGQFIDNNSEIIAFNRYTGNAIREANP